MDESNFYREQYEIGGERFYYQLYSAFLANCPVDSGNMIASITLEDMGDCWKITITALSAKGYDYARAVNYALAAKARMMNAGASSEEAGSNITASQGQSYQEVRDSRPNTKLKSGSLGISAKEAQNYMWVERTIRQTAEMFGGNVIYELS
jgi:hypothetical protein